MSNKQTEALKLAREALKLNCSSQTESPATKAIAAINEALAEQPAPPPPECQTEAEKTAFAFGWWKALEMHRTPAQQQEQEPVAWMCTETKILYDHDTSEVDKYHGFKPTMPLYAHPAPQPSKPLTDQAVWNLYKNLWMFHPAEEPRLAGDILKFARAIEAAHGIKEKPND